MYLTYRDLPTPPWIDSVTDVWLPFMWMWPPMDQAIPKEMWVRWDGLQTHNTTTQQVQPVQSLSTANDIKL